MSSRLERKASSPENRAGQDSNHQPADFRRLRILLHRLAFTGVYCAPVSRYLGGFCTRFGPKFGGNVWLRR
jgi:hypothetical protein